MADEYMQNGKTYVARMDEEKGYRAFFDEKGRQCFWFTCKLHDGSELDVLAPNRAIAVEEALDPDRDREDGLADIAYIAIAPNDENRAAHDAEIGRLDDAIRRTRPKSVSLEHTEDWPDPGTAVLDENGKTIDVVPFIVPESAVERELFDLGFAYLKQGAIELANLSRLEPDEAIGLFRKLAKECDRFLGEDLGEISILSEKNIYQQDTAIKRIDKMFRFEMSPDERLLLPSREEIERYGRSMALAYIAADPELFRYEPQEDARKLLAAFGRGEAKRWFFEYAESHDPSRQFSLEFKLAISGYAEQAGLDPLGVAYKLFGDELPKEWIENNATVLQRFENPATEGETVLFAVPETDPDMLDAGYTARILVSKFTDVGKPAGPAREFGQKLSAAYQFANPEIVQGACVEWTRDDLAHGLEGAGMEASEENIDRLALKASARGMVERMCNAGFKATREAAEDLKAESEAVRECGKKEPEVSKDEERSQGSR